jgi:CHAD domain-containing protein
MNKKKIEHITNEHYRKLKKHLKQLMPELAPETIHEFRVEYKKLRAFLRMISQEEETGEEIKIAKKLKKGYAAAGSIRDLQLQQQQILEVTRQTKKKPHAYLVLLKKEIEKQKPELSEIILQDPVAESKKKTAAAIPGKFTIKGFRNFARRKWATINAIISSCHFSDDNLHTIRKSLKDVFYNLEIYGGSNQGQGKWKQKDEQYFRTLIEELGSSQDKRSAISLLKSYCLNNLNVYNRVLLEDMKKLWTKQKMEMKKLLINKLKLNV